MLFTGQLLSQTGFIFSRAVCAEWWRGAVTSPHQGGFPAFILCRSLHQIYVLTVELRNLGDGSSCVIAGSFAAALCFAHLRNGWWIGREDVEQVFRWVDPYADNPQALPGDLDIFVRDEVLLPAALRLGHQLLGALHVDSPLIFRHHSCWDYASNAPALAGFLDQAHYESLDYYPTDPLDSGTVVDRDAIFLWEQQLRQRFLKAMQEVLATQQHFRHKDITVPKGKVIDALAMWDQTARAGLQLPLPATWTRARARAYRNSGNCRKALRQELPEELPQKLVAIGIRPTFVATQPDDRAYYSMMRCFGIEPPSRIQVVHQVNHHSDASACPTKYFDLIPCQVALRARDANGGGFVFDCSAHTRTCLLGNIIAYTPYAFDINNFVYAHLNNLAQEAPDVKPFEEMSPPEWASALEVTVKQFVYRIVKYRDKGFRRHAAQQQAQLAVHPNMLLTNNKSFDMPY